MTFVFKINFISIFFIFKELTILSALLQFILSLVNYFNFDLKNSQIICIAGCLEE